MPGIGNLEWHIKQLFGGYKYGKPENRPANIRNPNGYGALCKHLTSMLSNKKWLQQVTGTVMDWIVKNIDKVNEFLKPKEGQELTLPNELARANAKLAFYSKLFKDKFEEPDEEDEEELQDVDNKEQENNDTTQDEVELQDSDSNEEENDNDTE